MLYLFRLSCIFEQTSEQQPTFRIAKRKSREKKCRAQIEQNEHSANRINRIVKGIDDFVRRIFKYRVHINCKEKIQRKNDSSGIVSVSEM